MKSLFEIICESEPQNDILVESKAEEIATILKENNLEEGFIGTVLGGIAGMTAGAAIMKAVCKTLGLEKGVLYDVLTSKMVCAAAGAAIGNNLKI